MSVTSISQSAEAPQAARAPRVLLWGTFDTGKPRIRILSQGMTLAGIVLDTIHVDLWSKVEDKSQASGFWLKLRLAGRALIAYPSLLWRLLHAPRPDAILVSYPGVLDAMLAGAIGKLRRIPVVYDVFISLYDTVVEDRQLIPRNSLRARLLYAIERMGLRSADVLFMDTAAHARRLEWLFDLPEGSCGRVWVGAETNIFRPLLSPVPGNQCGSMSVLFYGQYIPLHGIPVIIEAARMLRDLPISWTLIGRGQESPHVERMIAADPLPRLIRIPWVDYAGLCSHLAAADLCLGIFGTSEKAACVIPNKVFQIIAAGRPLVTRGSPAIRELFSEPSEGVRLVEAGSAQALADAVRAHYKAGAWQTVKQCHGDVAKHVEPLAIGHQFATFFESRLGTGGSA